MPDMPNEGRSACGAGRGLMLLGALMLALYAGFIVVCVNVSQGYQNPYDLTPESVQFFSPLWPYPRLVLGQDTAQGLMQGLLAALWLTYGLAAFLASRALGRRALLAVLLLGLAFHVLLVLALPPILSSDVYLYALYGRAMSLRGANAAAMTFEASYDPPYSALTPWTKVNARYGPLWLLASAGLSLLAPQSVLGTLLAFKGLAAASSAAAAFFIYRLAQRFDERRALLALTLWWWNPLVLLEGAGSAHNDLFMVALALAGFLLAVSGKRFRGLALLVGSALVKYLSALLALLMVARWLGQERTWRGRIALLSRAAAVALAICALAYAPFLGDARPGEVLPSSETLFNPTPGLVRLALQAAAGLAIPGASPVQIDKGLSLVLNAAFGAWFAAVLIRTMRAVPPWEAVLADFGLLSLVYIVVVHGALFPWYLALPLGAISATPAVSRRRLALALGFALVYTLPYGMLFPRAGP